jgi:hypothetical protein
MASVPDISAIATSLQSNSMAIQAAQGPDLSARLGAAAFRLQEQQRQDQVTESAESAAGGLVGPDAQPRQAGTPTRRPAKGAVVREKNEPSRDPRTGSNLDVVA